MPLIIHCRICNDLIPNARIGRSICNKSECKRQRYRQNHPWTRSEIRCRFCNGIIPIGSGRRYYCNNDCRDAYWRRKNRLKNKIQEYK
ncbi:MAG TPA: hypothetical protein VMY59_09500 [Candidatus Thermoplasmatota archaeon]|nr:hypothetical protein [Candidatus Thermoplasmatota archaeon]